MIRTLHFHEKNSHTTTETQEVLQSYNFDLKAEEVAKERGLVVVYPEKNQLQFDLDTKEEREEFMKRCHEMINGRNFHFHEHVSPGGGEHRHVTLTFFDMEFTEWQRIALQSVLGSDPMREFLNARRLMEGATDKPTRLFETQETVEKMKANPPRSSYDFSEILEDIRS